ncbi:MAG TPA: hypothetical protein VE844_00190 [Gammaproteobacteria bacterium]|nr:hypothetical protein [Gammaproteobacteria bacterium]
MVESITVITLLLCALDRIEVQAIFDRDGYESRRRALPGARLVKVLVVYQMIHTAKLRGLIRTLTEHPGLQKALGGRVASIPCPMVLPSGMLGRWSRPGWRWYRRMGRGLSGWAGSSPAWR